MSADHLSALSALTVRSLPELSRASNSLLKPSAPMFRPVCAQEMACSPHRMRTTDNQPHSTKEVPNAAFDMNNPVVSESLRVSPLVAKEQVTDSIDTQAAEMSMVA